MTLADTSFHAQKNPWRQKKERPDLKSKYLGFGVRGPSESLELDTRGLVGMYGYCRFDR